MNTATLLKPKEKTEATILKETLLETRYPIRTGSIRKIVNVFSHYYRINYIDIISGFITESHFVSVENGVVKADDEIRL